MKRLLLLTLLALRCLSAGRLRPNQYNRSYLVEIQSDHLPLIRAR